MAFCILKSIEGLSGETTEVSDPVKGLINRNNLTPHQERAITEVKKILSPYWQLS